MRNDRSPNFNALWTHLVSIAESTNDANLLSVVKNHSNNKERICRKLGVVTISDINRIRQNLTRKPK